MRLAWALHGGMPCVVAVLAMALGLGTLPPAGPVQAGPAPSAGEGPRVTSQDGLVAAYLYNFTKYVEWPPPSFGRESKSVVIGVVGEPGVYRELAQIDGKASNGQTLRVRWFAAAAEAEACEVLFVGVADQRDRALLYDRLAEQAVLTVAPPGAADHEALVRLFMEQNKLRFEIDLPGAQRVGLTISSHLLRLARASSSASLSGIPTVGGQ